jgi:general secretion pathway protein G
MERVFRFWWLVLAVSVVGVIAIASRGELDGPSSVIPRAKTEIRVIETALELYKTASGRYPTNEEGLSALVGGQLARLPQDPWGTSYAYTLDQSGRPSAYSIGANHRDEAGLGDDVVLGDKSYRCEDYEFVCLRAEDIVARFALGAAVVSLLVGVIRGAMYIWRVLHNRGAAA